MKATRPATVHRLAGPKMSSPPRMSKSSRPGRLALVIGNGCCDSTAPYLFADYAAGPNERAIGEIAGVPVYLDESIVQTFESTEVVVDVRRGAADSFSCESELGWRFVLDRLPALHP